MKFRQATIDDLELLLHWDKQQHVIDCDPNGDWDWETDLAYNPEWRDQFIVEFDGRPIGFLQIIDPFRDEDHYWGEVADNLRAIDIWIGEKEDLGKGYGTQMMTRAINHCFANETVQSILIDPLATNFKAHRFYESLGFRFLEKRTFGIDECLVFRMERRDWIKK